MAKARLKIDWTAWVGTFKTAGALMIGNSFLVLLGIIGVGDDNWRLTKFVVAGTIGLFIIFLGSMTKTEVQNAK